MSDPCSPQAETASQDLAGSEDAAPTAEMPMTMAASVVLEHLPRDVHRALDEAGKLGVEKSE